MATPPPGPSWSGCTDLIRGPLRPEQSLAEFGQSPVIDNCREMLLRWPKLRAFTRSLGRVTKESFRSPIS